MEGDIRSDSSEKISEESNDILVENTNHNDVLKNSKPKHGTM